MLKQPIAFNDFLHNPQIPHDLSVNAPALMR
jgi:hypothetical protein